MLLAYILLSQSINGNFSYDLGLLTKDDLVLPDHSIEAETTLLSYLENRMIFLEQNKPAILRVGNRYFSYGNSNGNMWKFTELDAVVFAKNNFFNSEELKKTKSIEVCKHIQLKGGHTHPKALFSSALSPFTTETLTQQEYSSMAAGVLIACAVFALTIYTTPESIIINTVLEYPVAFLVFCCGASYQAPFMEESIFRGNLTPYVTKQLSDYGLDNNYAYYIAIAGSSAAFSILHFPPTPYSFMLRFIVALALEGLTAFSANNSLKPAVALHCAYNSSLCLFYLLAPFVGIYPICMAMFLCASAVLIKNIYFTQQTDDQLETNNQLVTYSRT